MAICWVVAPCNMVEFTDVSEALEFSIIRATHHPDNVNVGELLSDTTTQRTAIVIFAAVRT
jgi:hypothetical protein